MLLNRVESRLVIAMDLRLSHQRISLEYWPVSFLCMPTEKLREDDEIDIILRLMCGQYNYHCS